MLGLPEGELLGLGLGFIDVSIVGIVDGNFVGAFDGK